VRIFHIALRSEWEAARRSGSYTTSTLGRTLAEEGFIHASRADQWQQVRAAFYADVTEPLVLLVIDTDRLSAPVVEERPAEDAEETFPHIYGPLEADAVIQAVPLDSDGNPPRESFSSIFLGELFRNALLAFLLLAIVAVAAIAGRALWTDWGALVGAGIGLVVGVPVVVTLHRRLSASATR
jgi:uncharacterized protein (DUF952 family)